MSDLPLASVAVLFRAYQHLAWRLSQFGSVASNFPESFDQAINEALIEAKNVGFRGSTPENEAETVREGVEEFERHMANWRRNLGIVEDRDA